MAKGGQFGGFGGGNMQQLMRQAQKMQEQMQALQEELNAREYEVSAGGGMVKIKINGERRILSVSIDPDIVDPDDVETLEDIITAGVNEAIKLVDDTNTAEMNRLTGGLGLPGGLF